MASSIVPKVLNNCVRAKNLQNTTCFSNQRNAVTAALQPAHDNDNKNNNTAVAVIEECETAEEEPAGGAGVGTGVGLAVPM